MLSKRSKCKVCLGLGLNPPLSAISQRKPRETGALHAYLVPLLSRWPSSWLELMIRSSSAAVLELLQNFNAGLGAVLDATTTPAANKVQAPTCNASVIGSGYVENNAVLAKQKPRP